jgi:hypothetical protein
MNVHLVMAAIAISRARTGHQLGLCSRRLELDDLAQLDASFDDRFDDQLLVSTRASALSRTPASLMNPSASA